MNVLNQHPTASLPSTLVRENPHLTISYHLLKTYSPCVGYLFPIQVIHILISLYILLRRYAIGDIAS